MDDRTLDLVRRSGDQHLGQTLVRLARRAASLHRELEDVQPDSPLTPPAHTTRDHERQWFTTTWRQGGRP